ncbi:MAG: hypothetical protein ACRELZ_26265 [Candidatus Rokuibacteriota bacterium]
MTSAHPDYVLAIECGKDIVGGPNLGVARGRDDLLDRDRPPSFKEGTEDQPNERLLAGCPASDLPL